MTATSSTTAARLDIEESALTGEGTPVLTDLDVIDGTELGALQRVLDTMPLAGGQWLVCVGAAAALELVDEAVKAVRRLRQLQVVHAS